MRGLLLRFRMGSLSIGYVAFAFEVVGRVPSRPEYVIGGARLPTSHAGPHPWPSPTVAGEGIARRWCLVQMSRSEGIKTLIFANYAKTPSPFWEKVG